MAEILSDKQVREKALNLGIESLSNAELLSIIFRDGDRNRSALMVAEDLLEDAGGELSKITEQNIKSLRSMGSIGLSRAMYIKAAMELSARVGNSNTTEVATIGSSTDVVELFRPTLGSLDHEEFWALYLNSSGRILDKIRISQGGLTQTVVDHRIILKRAIENLATAIIVVHNHPSGDPTPSVEDKEITNRLVSATELLDIRIADHIILSATNYYSFRGNGLL